MKKFLMFAKIFHPLFFVSRWGRRPGLITLFLLMIVCAKATIYYSQVSGNANLTATWGTNPADGTGAIPGNFTTAGDVFVLRAASGLTTSGLWTIGNNVTLQVIGSLTTGSNVTIVGTLILDGTIAVNGASNIFRVDGTVIFTNPSVTQVSLAGAGAGNNFTLGAGSTLKTVNINGVSGADCSLPATAALKNIQFSTGVNFEFNGTTAQATLGLPATLDNLTINNPDGVNLNNNVRVTETLFLTNGAFSIGTNILTLDKGVTIATGSLNAASGTVIYNRNSNGQAVLAVNYGNLTFTNFNKILPSSGIIGIAGVFTQGTATGHTIAGSTIDFNGSAQAVPVFPYYNIRTSGSGVKTLQGTITVIANLVIGSGTTLDVPAAFGINIAGNWTNDGTLAPGAGTVTFNGNVTQLVSGGNTTVFNNLILNNSNSIGITLQQDVSINATLTLNSGIFDIDGKVLTLGSNANAIAGTFSNARMIVASGGGEVRKAAINASQASYTFPVGDNTGTTEYSPVTLTFSGGSYNGYSGVKVTDAKHPNNANTTNFLTRYWTIATSGFNGFSADVTASYTDTDVTGTEAGILTGKWNGAVPWQRFPASVDVSANMLTATAVTSFSDFTGINSADPTVTISADDLIVCPNEPVTLIADGAGDAPLTYLWNPGGATTTAFSPSTAEAGTGSYSVTVTDGNGFTASVSQDIIVNATPQGSLSSNGSICSGSIGELTFSATSGAEPFTVVYFDGVANRTQTGVTSGSAFSVFSNPTSTTLYTLVSISDNNGCSRSDGFTGGSATILINELPAISLQPSPQTVCEGDDVTFTVNATGMAIAYQWQKDGEDLSGETGNILAINAVTPSNAGNYTVVVNGICPPAVTSNVATLVVNTAPVVSATDIVDVFNDANNCSASVAFGSNVAIEGTSAATLVYKIGSTEIVSPHVFPVGTTTVTVEATNDCGATPSTFNVTVEDVTPPVPDISTLANITAECAVTVTTAPEATDNCSGTITGITNDALTYTTQGTHVINWSFDDGNGNLSVATQNVVIHDATLPAITCHPGSPFIRNTNAGTCGYKIIGSEFDPLSFSDNCAGTTIKNNINNSNSLANEILPKGNNIVVWTASDASGNTATCSVVITVEDHETPSITCPGNIVVTANQNTATWTEPAGNDNCPGWTVTRTGPAPGSAFVPGTTNISYLVTDASGNQNSCSFTVTNNNSPVANCTNTNTVLYFGYSGDQSATITATPTTGTGPYTISFTMSRPLLCNQVNDAGDEIWTTGDGGITINNLCPVGIGMHPVSTKTIASGAYSITVALMADADITATITDAAGSVTTCTTHIHAEDVRCFAGASGKSKITICHKTGSSKNPCVKICVDQEAVNEHLAHGDFLGKCTSDCKPPESSNSLISGNYKQAAPDVAIGLNVKVFPNPATTEFHLIVNSNTKEKIEIVVFDVYGKKVYQAKGSSNEPYRFGRGFAAGTYILRLSQGTKAQMVKLIKGE